MKANELRIGNWYYDFGIPNGIPKQVSPNVILKLYQIDIAGKIAAIDLTPIPLTEDWLLKFGFRLTVSNKDSGYKQYGIVKKGFDIMFSIECNCNPECFLENIGIDVLYVHQLQNLYFALTGKELTICNK